MKISNIIKNLILNNEQKEYNKDDVIYSFYKRKIEENKYAIYMIDFYDEMSQNIELMGLVDFEKEEFIYLDDAEVYGYLDMLLANPKEYKHNTLEYDIMAITNSVKEILIKEIENNIDITKECNCEINNFSACLENYIKTNKNKTDEEFIYRFYLDDYLDLYTLSGICQYYNNPSTIINEIANKYIKDNEEQFNYCVAKFSKLEKELNKIENNEYKKQRDDLYKILKEIEYKSVNIHYTDLNNDIKVKNFNVSKLQNNTYQLYMTNVIGDAYSRIPIHEIDKITWKNKELYNKTNYDEIIKDDLERAKAWFDCNKLRNVNVCPQIFNNKEFMNYILENNIDLIFYLGDELRKDHDYILDIIKKHHTVSFHNIKEIFKDEKFVYKFFNEINNLRLTDKNIEFLIKNLEPKFINDFEIIKKISNISNMYLINCLISEIDDATLNNKEILKHIDPSHFSNMNYGNIYKITNVEILYELCESNEFFLHFLIENIDELHENIINERDFISYLFSNEKANNNNYDEKLYSDLIKRYKDDEYIVNLLAKMVDESYADDFVEDFGIDINNIDRMYELSSINIGFLYLVSQDEQYTYLASEASEIFNLEILTEDEIEIKTAYGAFVYDYDYQEITFIDQLKTGFNINDEFNDKQIKDIDLILTEAIIEFDSRLAKCENLSQIHCMYKELSKEINNENHDTI